MIRPLLLALAFTLPVHAQSPDPITKLTPWDPGGGQKFGFGVAAAGRIIAVGAWGDASAQGSAYIYRYDGDSWVEEQKLVAAAGAPGHNFGASLLLREELVVVGAPYYGYPNYESSGAAYIFRHDGNSWVEEQQLRANPLLPLQSHCNFGISIAGNTTSETCRTNQVPTT